MLFIHFRGRSEITLTLSVAGMWFIRFGARVMSCPPGRPRGNLL